VLPELNDDFAKSISPELGTISAVREEVKKQLEKAAEDRAHSNYEDKVIDALVKISKAEFPPY